MPSVMNTVALVGSLAAGALAHGHVTGFRLDSVYEPGYSLDYYYAKQNGKEVPIVAAWSAENLDNGFVDGTGYQTVDIVCHKKAAPGKKSAKIAAGGTVDFLWTAWPDSHMGPVLTYAAKCDGDCTTADPATLKWVKIQESGYEDGTWASLALIKNNNTGSATIPADFAPGNYVLRHEIIAMHGAGSENGAQNYPQCVNVEVTGSGTATPEGVLGTELYKSTDPGILFSPYQAKVDYTPPGPPLYGKGSSTTPTTPTTPYTPTTPSNGTVPATSAAASAAAEDEYDCPSKKLRRHARDLFHSRH
ncbi:Endoglucanase-7 [Colletotrichum trifolii]|uniref:lytic cellulose monooxygenase (C4-dehydrogenating) n=1 Tax=Colletotrichum trifolii TaxID=5466 RepID=A0A4R8QYD0_COLTR|nr:Endoglucanase-7 [Colletotrichum trifolii]